MLPPEKRLLSRFVHRATAWMVSLRSTMRRASPSARDWIRTTRSFSSQCATALAGACPHGAYTSQSAKYLTPSPMLGPFAKARHGTAYRTQRKSRRTTNALNVVDAGLPVCWAPLLGSRTWVLMRKAFYLVAEYAAPIARFRSKMSRDLAIVREQPRTVASLRDLVWLIEITRQHKFHDQPI
jgi:hypothetical protein